jgi:ribose transport system permease protein
MNSWVGRLLFRGSTELAVLAGIFVVLMLIYFYYDRTIFQAPSILALAVQTLPLAFFAGGWVAARTSAVTGHSNGLLNGVLVARAGLPPIIVTLATSFLWSGVAVWLLPKPAGSVPDGLRQAYTKGWYGINMPVVVLLLVLLAWKYLSRTSFGLSVYAVGGNEHGAFANGISVRRVQVGAYLMSSVFIAFAGIVLAVQTGTADATIGSPYTLNSIAASILGGIIFLGGVGYMRGAVLGALVVVVLSNILLFSGVSPFYQLVVQGAILIVAVSAKTILNTEKGVV